MSDICLMMHGCLQWGYRQMSEWHFLAEVYGATLTVVEDLPDVRLTVQLAGQDLEWLAQTHPDLLDRIKALAASGRVEVAMGGYSHNFQGATPQVNVANLELAQEACAKTLGLRADGYWPAEAMLNRGMPAALQAAGFSYCWFDNLSVQGASALEHATGGHTYALAGAFGATIDALPFMHFEGRRRGSAAGILDCAMRPDDYPDGPGEVVERAGRYPLVVEASDWEHFNVSEQKARETHMGTFDTGARFNAIDPDKIDAWRNVLQALTAGGHQFVMAREALAKHPRHETLQLIDGRDYTKNDLTRLVDGCAWYDTEGGGLANIATRRATAMRWPAPAPATTCVTCRTSPATQRRRCHRRCAMC
jgi:hypothetical protein